MVKVLKPKQLFGHIFYTNQNDNFNYGYKGIFDSHGRGQEPPKEFIADRQLNTINDLKDQFEGKTLFLIGSGPSLNKNIDEFVSLYSDDLDAVVVACDGSVHDLSKLGFRPDFVASCEADGNHNRPGVPTTDDILIGQDVEMYSDVPLIACTWLSNSFLNNYPCDTVYWYVNNDRRYEYAQFWDNHKYIFPHGYDWPTLEPHTSTVGFHCIALGKYLKCKEVVLLGYDFQVVEKDKHHSAGFNLNWQDTNTCLIANYRTHLNRFLKEQGGKFGVPVVNCTEGGALTEQQTDCKVMKLRDKMNEMRQ